MDQRLGYLVNALGTVIILVLILSFINIGELVSTILSVDLFLFSMALLVCIAVNLMMVTRIYYLLGKMGHGIKFTSIIKSHLSGMLMSDFTPARSGYFFTAISLSANHSIPLERSILSILGPQIIDFMGKLIFAFLLILWVMNSFSVFQGSEALILLGILGIALVLVFFSALILSKRLLRMFLFMEKLPLLSKLFHLFRLMQDNSKLLLSEIWVLIGFAILGAFLKGLEWFFIAQSLGIVITGTYLDVFFFMFFHPMITFIQFLPIPTLAGAGAGEAAGAAILAVFMVPASIGIAFGFLTRGIMILVDVFGLPEILSILKKQSIGSVYSQVMDLEKKA